MGPLDTCRPFISLACTHWKATLAHWLCFLPSCHPPLTCPLPLRCHTQCLWRGRYDKAVVQEEWAVQVLQTPSGKRTVADVQGAVQHLQQAIALFNHVAELLTDQQEAAEAGEAPRPTPKVSASYTLPPRSSILSRKGALLSNQLVLPLPM